MTNGEIVSVSKKMATLEMKELNERQRAEHAQRMYEQLRDSLRQVEQRNFDLENKFVEVSLSIRLFGHLFLCKMLTETVGLTCVTGQL